MTKPGQEAESGNVSSIDLLKPLRVGAPRRMFKIGPVLFGVAFARDWTWARQNDERTKRTEYLLAVHRVTRATKDAQLTAIEVFAGPIVGIGAWVGLGSNTK